MSNQTEVKATFIEQTEDKLADNVFHSEMNDNVNLITIAFDKNKHIADHLVTKDGNAPKLLEMIKSKYEFKGNIRVSNSGKSWNIFRNAFDADDSLVTITI